MANLDAAVYTAQTEAADNAGKYIDSAELISGKVSFLQLTWTALAGNTTNDIVRLGYLPSGMTLIPELSTVSISDAGGANQPALGIESEGSTNILTAFDVSVDGVFNLGSLRSSSSLSYKAAQREVISLKLSGAITTNAEFKFNFFLVNSN